MKRYLVISLALLMVFCAASCGKGEDSVKESDAAEATVQPQAKEVSEKTPVGSWEVKEVKAVIDGVEMAFTTEDFYKLMDDGTSRLGFTFREGGVVDMEGSRTDGTSVVNEGSWTQKGQEVSVDNGKGIVMNFTYDNKEDLLSLKQEEDGSTMEALFERIK